MLSCLAVPVKLWESARRLVNVPHEMTTSRAIPTLLRDLNERAVLETIRAGAPISRAEISRRSGISKPTVSLVLESLLEADLVREAADRPDGPGYGAVYFQPLAEAAVVLGLDLGAPFVRGAELHRGRHGAAGEIDFALIAFDGVDPSAPQVTALAGGAADPRAVFGAAREGDEAAQAVVAEVARRIALHIAPFAAVADVELVILGGGIGANGDLLLDPIGRQLAEWLPFPPRLEVSTLGEAAVLTGALAVGVEVARENVFSRR